MIKFGWKRDLPDHNDKRLQIQHFATLPTSVDLRPFCPPVYDQGELGSCTANAVAGLSQFLMIKQKNKDVFVPSRLFIYYNERVLEGTVNEDAGATLRSGMTVANTLGNPHEGEWWYDTSKDKFKVKPNQKVYADGAKHKVSTPHKITPLLTQLKGSLAEGFPFVFGFSVYESFMSDEVAKTGIMPMPKKSEAVLGGHATCSVGFADDKQCFIIRNSWGEKWGLGGNFMMPYAFITDNNYADDFWSCESIAT
jgi:C1A family cysteine protease